MPSGWPASLFPVEIGKILMYAGFGSIATLAQVDSAPEEFWPLVLGILDEKIISAGDCLLEQSKTLKVALEEQKKLLVDMKVPFLAAIARIQKSATRLTEVGHRAATTGPTSCRCTRPPPWPSRSRNCGPREHCGRRLQFYAVWTGLSFLEPATAPWPTRRSSCEPGPSRGSRWCSPEQPGVRS